MTNHHEHRRRPNPDSRTAVPRQRYLWYAADGPAKRVMTDKGSTYVSLFAWQRIELERKERARKAAIMQQGHIKIQAETEAA